MQSNSEIEFADLISRRRAIGFAAAALVFLCVQLIGRPVFRGDHAPSGGPAVYLWAVNVIALLLLLVPAAGIIWSRRVRELLNDDVARDHARMATAMGFWLAMAITVTLYVLPASQAFSVREAAYLIVTPTVTISLFGFAWLEARAHRDE